MSQPIDRTPNLHRPGVSPAELLPGTYPVELQRGEYVRNLACGKADCRLYGPGTVTFYVYIDGIDIVSDVRRE
jgi:hypothetical protein